MAAYDDGGVMTMFWIVVGVVVAVLLVVAWLYDHKFGFNADRLPSADRRARAEADGHNTQRQANHFGPP